MNEKCPDWKNLQMIKSGGLYNLHSYWTKQSVDVIKKFIDFYTSENDKILDPFCGTGTTGVAAKTMGRISYLFDISPICCEISKGFTTKINNLDKLDHELKKFKDHLENLSKDLMNIKYDNKFLRIKYVLLSRDYKCPKCEKIFNTFNEESKLLREKKIGKFIPHCPKCGYDHFKNFEILGLKTREITCYNK